MKPLNLDEIAEALRWELFVQRRRLERILARRKP